MPNRSITKTMLEDHALVELGGMTKNLYHCIFLNYTGFTVYDGIYFFSCMTGC